jgi:AcrR family transcriptional regulator
MAAPRISHRQPSELRRPQIADAALNVIAEQGLRKFTARAIAREVGVSDAALYRHFPSTRAIVHAAIERVQEVLFEGFPPADPDPLERLGRFFRQRASAVAGHPGIARLMFSEDLAHAAAPEGGARVAEMKRRSVGFVLACLEEARRRRLLVVGLAPRDAAVVVTGSLMALLHAGRGTAGSEAAEQAAQRVWRTLEHLLRREPKARAAGLRREPAAAVSRLDRH